MSGQQPTNNNSDKRSVVELVLVICPISEVRANSRSSVSGITVEINKSKK